MDETSSLLMEKLRTKSGAYKSFKEYSKSLRMTLLEKRYALEATEKKNLQDCLDILQQNIIVSTLSAIIERLTVISRHLGLKLRQQPGRALAWFISSDMFYVEVVLESNGDIKDVKIHHEGNDELQNCEELKITLEKRDFKDFTLHLEGLISIYNLDAEKPQKMKAFSSLQFLEADIVQLSDLQSSFMTDPFLIIHKSNVGLVQKRRGGHPMKIIYFISPYDLLDITKKTFKPLTLDLPEVDYCLSLCLESYSTNKLQAQPLVKIIKSEKIDEHPDSHQPTHIFEELTTTNSNLLPARFVMKLKERLPICESLIEQMKEITGMKVNKIEGPFPILSLIKREIHKKFVECDEDSSVVTLPDQRHCYIMTENYDMQAYIIQSIPFSHPSHVTLILPLLRQQALFNSFIASCIRPKAAEDSSDKLNKSFEASCDPKYSNGFGLKFFGSEDLKDLNTYSDSSQKLIPSDITMFEVIPLSLQQITVSFEHPVDETLITAGLDLTDVSELRCDISMASEETNTSVTNAQECAARALQRSFSIPATMRALIKLWETPIDTSDEEDMNESSTNNDVADLNELAENNMETENTKENGDCPSLKFEQGVTIKIETSDSCDNSLDGFPSLANRNNEFNSDEVFNLPNNPLTLSFDTEMIPANSFNLNEPLPFLDNAGEQPLFAGKSEPMDLIEPFFTRKAVAGDSYGGGAKPRQRMPNECEIVIDSSSDSEQPNTPRKEAVAEAKDPSPCSSSSLEFSALTELSGEVPMNEKPAPTYEMEVNSLEDVEQFLKITENKIPKNEDSNALTSVLSELENKSLVPPSVSITPIASAPSSTTSTTQCSQSFQSFRTSMCLERRPGIEIIPITSSSLTITPISAKDVPDDRAKLERKKTKTGDDKARLEKKKKRKHDDSPMGPPEKIPAKSDPLSKPVSLSIKPTESSPRSPSPSNTLRKFTVSPTTQVTSLTLVGKVSPNSNTTNNNIKSSKSQNFSNSPSPVTGSPKIGLASSSPKHSITSSPKNLSSASSGKPSMSALKSAVTSPSSGTKINSEVKSSKSHKDSSTRDHKDKKSSSNGSGSGSGHQSPKPKSSSGKFKQVDMQAANFTMSPQHEGNFGTSLDPKLALSLAQGKNKKGSLSAVIDKLKLQKHCGDGVVDDGCGNNGNGKSGAVGVKDAKNTPQIIRAEDAKNLAVAKVPGEYMVKQASEGIKITINKTRTKDSSSKSSSTKNSSIPPGSGSPKHAGLKAPVNSSQICKKSVPYKPPLSGSSSNKISGGNLSSKHSSKSSSSSKSKTNHSPKGFHGIDLNRRDKVRSSSKDNKSIFTGIPKRSSPATQESGEGEKPYKPQPPYQPPVVGIKPLDTNFQIPKISDRNKSSGEGDAKKSEPPGNNADERVKDVKTDTASPIKVAYVNIEDPRALIDPTKAPNSFDVKAKNTPEISMEAINTTPHSMTSNCSISATVQSNDGIKLNLTDFTKFMDEVKIIPDVT